MGPGYFPMVLAVLLTGLGLAIIFTSFRRRASRSALCLARHGLHPSAPVFFGLTVRGLGFVPSIFLSTLIAAMASLKMKPLYAVGLALAITAFCTLVFSLALGLPFRLSAPGCGSEGAIMDLLANLGLGFATAASPENLLFCLIGVILGTLIGVLPGIGATATIAMLLPITFQLEPVSSLIMLAGIYYGAQYGGSTTAILINMPGESSSAVTAIDGYQMARKGKAGTALAVAALGSFFAGTVATLLVAIFAPPLTIIALKFGAAEYFSLMVLGLVSAIALAHGSILKALAMVVLGLLLGLVGTDIYTGTPRFTFGITAYADGLNFVALAVGCSASRKSCAISRASRTARFWDQAGSLWPSRADLKAMVRPCCAARQWARRWACCRAAARCWPPLPPTPWKSACRRRPKNSARAPSRAWPGRSPPTTPARRPASSRC
jgi:hypothetical protein